MTIISTSILFQSTCDGFQCLDACEVDLVLRDEMDEIQTEMTSHKHGNIEAACGMAKVWIICLRLWRVSVAT